MCRPVLPVPLMELRTDTSTPACVHVVQVTADHCFGSRFGSTVHDDGVLAHAAEATATVRKAAAAVRRTSTGMLDRIMSVTRSPGKARQHRRAKGKARLPRW